MMMMMMMMVLVTLLGVSNAFKRAPRSGIDGFRTGLRYRIGDNELDVIKSQIMKAPESYRKSWWRESEEVAKEKSLMSAETIAGRVAMLAFTILMVNELFTGESFLEQLLMDLGVHL